MPGGVARDLDDTGKGAIRQAVKTIRQKFPELVELYDETASLQDRTVATGNVEPVLAEQYGAGGFVGRASGRAFDARRKLRLSAVRRLRFEVPVLTEGDVNARVWIRIREVEQSLSLIDQILGGLPNGDLRAPLPPRAEAARRHGGGRRVFAATCWSGCGWRGGKIERCHLRDPSWFQWPLLEAAIEGNIVADFPICNKSFNCSYSGVDL